MDQIYAYETIDPTLSGVESFLGDAGLDGEVDVLGMEAGTDNQVPQKSNSQEKVDVRLYNNESFSTALSFSFASPRSKKKERKSGGVSESYLPKIRVIPDMLCHVNEALT